MFWSPIFKTIIIIDGGESNIAESYIMPLAPCNETDQIFFFFYLDFFWLEWLTPEKKKNIKIKYFWE